jgi:hypothetical protein
MSGAVCELKARLLKAYQAGTEEFSRAVTELQQLRGKLQLDEYRRLQQSSEEARLKSEEARIALEKHITEHRC